mmetsp:Transcript_46793/g.133731  ORF Transcript_46793/g.133731 Transcript_46793/m.133731 type:complete len:201 (+) Transcript_46793:155-757(+)
MVPRDSGRPNMAAPAAAATAASGTRCRVAPSEACSACSSAVGASSQIRVGAPSGAAESSADPPSRSRRWSFAYPSASRMCSEAAPRRSLSAGMLVARPVAVPGPRGPMPCGRANSARAEDSWWLNGDPGPWPRSPGQLAVPATVLARGYRGRRCARIASARDFDTSDRSSRSRCRQVRMTASASPWPQLVARATTTCFAC